MLGNSVDKLSIKQLAPRAGTEWVPLPQGNGSRSHRSYTEQRKRTIALLVPRGAAGRTCDARCVK